MKEYQKYLDEVLGEAVKGKRTQALLNKIASDVGTFGPFEPSQIWQPEFNPIPRTFVTGSGQRSRDAQWKLVTTLDTDHVLNSLEDRKEKTNLIMQMSKHFQDFLKSAGAEYIETVETARGLEDVHQGGYLYQGLVFKPFGKSITVYTPKKLKGSLRRV